MAKVYMTSTGTGNPANQTTDPATGISTAIDYNNSTITTAKITLTYTGTLPTIYLSADGGDNWETCTDGVAHTFTATGTDLRWKLKGNGSCTVTKIEIEDYH